MSKIIKVLSEPIFTEMHEGLKRICCGSLLQNIQQSTAVAKKAAADLNNLIKDYTFKDLDEEIHFYKELLPIVNRKIIYYSLQYDVVANKPIGNTEKMSKYLIKEMKRHQKYFDKNQEFIHYYRLEQTHLDQAYFTKNVESPVPPEFHLGLMADENTAIFYSMKLAKIQALDKLVEFIEGELTGAPLSKPEDLKEQDNQLVWTDSKIALIELAYALVAIGAFNNGKAKIGQTIKYLEGFFNIKLGNHYAGYHQNIRQRASVRTAYLKKLKDKLDDFMEDND